MLSLKNLRKTRSKTYRYFVLWTLCLIQQNKLIALDTNTKIEQATDSEASHCFVANPAAFHPSQPGNSLVQLMNYRVYHNYTYKERQQDNEQKEDGEKNDSHNAGAISAALGSGLWLHINGEQFSSKGRYKRESSFNNNIPESTEGNLAQIKVGMMLSSEIYAGFGLRYMDLQHEVVGSFSINPQIYTTKFHTSLVGFSAGFQYITKLYAIDAYYLPALKDTTTILGEEKLITEPGYWSFGGSYQIFGSVKAGLRYKKMLYKKDDRPDGTTINDQNRTRINLVGLNREDIHLFPLSAMLVGFSWENSQDLSFYVSLEKQYTSFIRQPAVQSPGANPNDPFATRQLLKFMGRYQKSKLHIFTGLVLSDQKMDVSDSKSSSTSQRIFESKRKDLWFGVGSYL